MSDNLPRPFSSASFNTYLSENKLMASRCDHCDAKFIPPRAVCPNCFSDQMSWSELSGSGKVAALTTVFIGPTFMNTLGYSKENPYMCGIVELDEGLRISARLLGSDGLKPEEMQIGAPVQVAYIQVGDGETSKIQLAFQRT